MGKDDEIIMVVKKEKLFGSGHFLGFKEHEDRDYLSEIMKNVEWKKRGDVESDFSYKQIIPYVAIFNPINKKFFFFRRAKKEANYREKRLYGRWSFGAGGHISQEDSDSGWLDTIKTNILREINEEVKLNGKILSVKIKGYINDESDEVGRVHFGLFYILETDSEDIKPSEECSIVEFKMINTDELSKYISEKDLCMEQWSNIAFEHLKKM